MSLNTELKRKEQEIENEGRDEYKRIKKINMLCTIYTWRKNAVYQQLKKKIQIPV
jgi:hypothetical protein